MIPIRPFFVIAALAGTTGHVLSGQEPDDSGQVRLSPLVVTATRLPTSRASVSATVTVLDGAQLRARGTRYVKDALHEVPGLTVVQTGSFGGNTSLFVRGGESDYVKILVDGVPVNEPGGAFDFANLTTDNIERIEIVRGPVSVLYGSDAVAGVVQIITRRGEGAPRGEIGVRAGTYGSLDWDAEFQGGIDRVNYSFTLARTTTDGILAFNNSYDNVVWSGTVWAVPDERTQAKLSLRYSDSEFHFPTDGSGSVVDRNAFRLQTGFAGALDVGRFFTDRIEGRVLLALNDVDGGLDDRSDGAADTVGFFGFTSSEAIARRSVDARANYYLGVAHVLTLGAQYEQEKEREFSESLSEFGNSTTSLDVERANYAYYAQLHTTPVTGLAVTLGGRIDDNDAFGTFFTYRAGTTYQLVTGTRLRASVGKAFKEPTFFENFANSPFAMGDPNLEPERSTSWEIGGEQTLLEGRIRVSGTYFNQQFRDLIQFTFTPPSPGDPNFFNIAAADASGVELEARATAVPHLSIGASYAYLNTEVVDAGFDQGPGAGFVEGERLLRRPTHTFSAHASYRLQERAFFWTRLSYVGDRDDRDFSTFPADSVVLPGYTKFDVATEVEVLSAASRLPGLTATVRIENLFGEKYEQVHGFPAPGRTVLVGARVRF